MLTYEVIRSCHHFQSLATSSASSHATSRVFRSSMKVHVHVWQGRPCSQWCPSHGHFWDSVVLHLEHVATQVALSILADCRLKAPYCFSVAPRDCECGCRIGSSVSVEDIVAGARCSSWWWLPSWSFSRFRFCRESYQRHVAWSWGWVFEQILPTWTSIIHH